MAELHRGSEYAVGVADRSYQWYKSAAIRSRRLHRSSELSVIVISALVPLSAVVLGNNVVVPALLGSVVVIITGFRSIFHWHENYLRFSRAREAVETERRKYSVGAPPYADPNESDAALVKAITNIEQEEMGKWLQVAQAPSSKSDSTDQ